LRDKKVSFGYILVTFVAVLGTWILHEFAHWLTSELLGYQAIMRFNTVSPLGEEAQLPWHSVVISSSGPIITVVQALIIYLFLQLKGWNKYLYPFLFTTFYMRLLAGFMNIINLNDEGRIGVFLGIGTFTLPVIVSGSLFLMVYLVAMKYKLTWKFNSATTLLVMLFSSILIMLDQLIGIRIL